MFCVNKQVFIKWSSFRKCFATKCVSLNNEPSLIRPFLLDWNPAELK